MATLIYRTHMDYRQINLIELERIRNTEYREVTERDFNNRLRDLNTYATQSWTAPLRNMVTSISKAQAQLRKEKLNGNKRRIASVKGQVSVKTMTTQKNFTARRLLSLSVVEPQDPKTQRSPCSRKTIRITRKIFNADLLRLGRIITDGHFWLRQSRLFCEGTCTGFLEMQNVNSLCIPYAIEQNKNTRFFDPTYLPKYTQA